MDFYAYAFLREQIYLEGKFDNVESNFFYAFEKASAELASNEMMRVRYLTEALPKDLLLWTARSLKHDIEKQRTGYFHDIDQKVSKIDKWDETLKAREVRVKEQIASLQNQLEKVNFVGLSRTGKEVVV